MCYSEGALQAYLDGEVQGEERRRMDEHLRTCTACREALRRLADAKGFADQALGTYLESSDMSQTELRAGWNRLQSSLRPARYRPAIIAMAAVLTLAIGLSFGSVRAAAGRFLGVFRVNRFQVVTVTPADLSRIEAAVRQGAGAVKIANLGDIEFSSAGPRGLVSLTQAKQAVDFQLRLPSAMPEGLQLQGLTAEPSGTLHLTLDVVKANQLLKSLGGTKMLPAELNGQTFSVTVPAAIDAQYGGSRTLHVLQARSPELDMPGDTSAESVRDAVLGMPFLPDSLKRQVASVNDWQHTFLVPNVQGSTQQVTVDGTDGVYITAPSQYKGEVPGAGNVLVWQKDGVVYAIVGEFSLEQGLQIGNSMR